MWAGRWGSGVGWEVGESCGPEGRGRGLIENELYRKQKMFCHITILWKVIYTLPGVSQLTIIFVSLQCPRHVIFKLYQPCAVSIGMIKRT